MREDKEKKKKQRKGWSVLRTVVSLVVLIALLCGAAFLIANRDSLTGDSLADTFNKWFGKKSGVGDALEFDVFSGSLFAELGSGAVIVSDTCVQVVSSKGERITREPLNLKEPAVASAGDWALAWDIGSTTAMQIGEKGACRQMTAIGAIISASICESGAFCIASEASGYKGAVSVYTEKGALHYQWFSGENYLMDADLAPSGNRFAALTLGDSGSKVSVFSIDDASEKGSFLAEDELFFEIEYLSENRICLLSDKRMVLLNGDGEQIGEYGYAEEYLRDYQLNGNGYATLLLCTYSTGSTGRIVTVDSAGKETASLEVTEDVLSLSVSGKYIATAYPDRTVLYSSGLSERGVYTTAGVRSVVSRRDGSAILVTNSSAFIFNP